MEIAYGKKYYELERDQWWCRARRELIVGLMRSYPKSSRILEIGCAGGYLLQSFKENGFQNISGIDVSHEAVSLCRAKGLDVRLGDGGAVWFPDQSFDVIIASDVLEHIRDDKAALRSWSRMLASGGVLMCFVPAFQFLWSGHDVANHHERRYRLPRLVHLVRGAGLLPERASFWNFFLFFPTAIIRGVAGMFHRGTIRPQDQFYAFGGGFANAALLALVRFENRLFLRGVNFSVGVSAFVLARKSS